MEGITLQAPEAGVELKLCWNSLAEQAEIPSSALLFVVKIGCSRWVQCLLCSRHLWFHVGFVFPLPFGRKVLTSSEE